MIEEIRKLFKDEFIEQSTVDELIVDLSESGEGCKIKFIGGVFVEIKDTLIESFGNKLLKGKLGENCDAIIINKSNSSFNLVLVEYKNNIGFRNFEKACTQLNATYLKTAALINLVHKIEDINVVYISVGKIHEKTQSIVLASKTNNLNLFNRLVEEGETIIKKIPFRLDLSINEIFCKLDVRFIHSECNSTVITF